MLIPPMNKNIIKPERDKSKYFLDRNENLDLKLKQHIESLVHFSDKNYNLYPDKLEKAYNTFQSLLGIDKSEIVFTNGSEEGIRLIFNTFLSKNDVIVKWEPTFGLVNLNVNHVQAKSIDLGFKLVNYTYKFNEYKSDFSPKMFYISSPNSPTGSVFDKNELIHLLDKHKSSLFVLDGAYVDYDEDFYLDLYRSRNNIIIVRTFSKAWGIAGLRFGYFLTKKTQLQNCRPNYAPNNIALDVGLELLCDPSWVHASIKRSKESKLELIDFLKIYNIHFIKTIGNFIIFDSNRINIELLSLFMYFKTIQINKKTYIKISIPDINDVNAIIRTIKNCLMVI
jgi:histidinol-phosphate aminotransferase